MGKTYLYWDPQEDNVVREYDEGGVVTAEYTTEPELYGNIISQRRQGEYRQFHYDGQGSTLAVTDESENVTDTFAYTAFGEVTERTGTTEVPFQYVGQKGYYTEGLTGQIFVRRRPYEPAKSRWLSEDPHGFRSLRDVNLFVYASNSPLVMTDPSGLKARRTEKTAQIDCPGYGCVGGPCLFSLSLDPKPGAKGELAIGSKICLQQKPGEFERPPTDLVLCQSEINRNLKGSDHFTITLNDGTECKFTEPIFPPNESWPPIWTRLPPLCKDVIDIEEIPHGRGPPLGGCYVTTVNVKAIAVDFTINVSCFCSICKEWGENRDTIRLRAKAP